MNRMERVTLDNKYRWIEVIMGLDNGESLIIALSKRFALYAERADDFLNLTLFEGHCEDDEVVMFVFDKTLNKYSFSPKQNHEAVDMLEVILQNYAKCRGDFLDAISGIWGAVITLGFVAAVSIFTALM